VSGTTFADRLREAIGARSRREVAASALIPESTIRNYERGSEPTLSKLVALADALDVNPEWLATGCDRIKDADLLRKSARAIARNTSGPGLDVTAGPPLFTEEQERIIDVYQPQRVTWSIAIDTGDDTGDEP
jgi:transcriptional regulator with XRE-family HTH domain